jgi:SAM-dependent methyltransferase
MASRAERAMSFGAVADDYDRLRPGPPDAALDWLVPDGARVVVDVGAGTGLLTRALARRVARVVAVEPDERMRAVLQSRSPGVEVVAGRGEALPLPDASADGVFVSSAWHWLDPDLAVPEISRILRDGGRLGVLWTSIDREASWLRDLRRPGGLATGPDDSSRDDSSRDDSGSDGSGRDGGPRRPNRVVLPHGAPLRDMATQVFRFTRAMAADSLVELLGTYSGMITAGARDREAVLAYAARALAERFPGASQIDVPMSSWCWRADRAARPDRS